VTLTKENVKSNFTEVHYEQVDGGRVITKIRLAGSKEGLAFKQDTPRAE
jgi:pentose-5-phosphate-3-epimerase